MLNRKRLAANVQEVVVYGTANAGKAIVFIKASMVPKLLQMQQRFRVSPELSHLQISFRPSAVIDPGLSGEGFLVEAIWRVEEGAHESPR